MSEHTGQERRLAYYAELVESMEEAVIAMDAQFVVTAWNRGAQAMFGWTAAETVGRAVHEFNPRSVSDEELAQQFSDLQEEGRWRGEAMWHDKYGKPVIAEALTVALRSDGVVTGYLSIVRDVAERQQARMGLATRAHRQALVADLSLRARVSNDLQALFDDAVAVVARMLEVEIATVAETVPGSQAWRWRAALGWSREAIAKMALSPPITGTLASYTLRTGGPVISDDIAADGRFEISPILAQERAVSAVAVVIPGPAEPFGALGAAAREHRSFTSDDVNLMQAVANVLGSAVERSRVEERLEKEVENERRRIARDLHDAVLGGLTAAIARATIARSSSAEQKDKQRWAEMITVLQGVAQELRSSIYNLRLTGLEDRGFADLLTDLVAIRGDMAVDCEVRLHGRESLPTGSLGLRGIELIRIVGEAITNACRHSGATTVRVDARRPSRDVLRLEISDDGGRSDQDPAGSHEPGTGITGMFERAQLLGATLLIESRPGRGTVVSLELDEAQGVS